MKIPEKTIAEKLLEQFCDGYKRRDLEFLLSLFTQDITSWGTAPDEYIQGLEQMKRHLQRDWEQSEKSEIRIISFVPSTYEAPWAAAFCQAVVTIDGQEHIFDQLRGTIVIEQEDGVWKIAHTHASFPDFRGVEDSSFPVR